MSKNNFRNKGKQAVELKDRVLRKHNECYMQHVTLYQSLIEEFVEDGSPEEEKLRAYIFKKVNVKWIQYCELHKKSFPKPDNRFFYNNIKQLSVC